jgi:GAF domain-containing protein
MSTASATREVPARLLAWSLVGVAVVLAALQTWLFLGWSAIRADPGGWPVLTLGLLLWAVLGAVIVGRYPRHRVAWLFIAAALLASLGDCLSGYSEVASSGRPLWSWAVWLGLLLDGPQPLFFLSLLFLLFPTGHLLSRRWLPVAAAAWLSFGALVVAMAVAVPPWSITAAGRDELYEGGWSAYPVAFLLFFALLGTLLASTASVVVRMRRARGVEHQQLRWLAVASSGVAGGFLLSAVLPWHSGFLGWLRVLPVQLSVVAVVAGAALAILRYRLYDLDIVVSRAILLTASTLVVAAGYTGLVVLVGSILPVREAFWPSLLALAAVALAFQPLRGRIVRFADRLAFGPRAVPYEALADFGRGLEQAPGPVDLLRTVAHAVVDATGARAATAVLELPDGSEVAQGWPVAGEAPRTELVVVPVTDRGERLGRVELAMPPGRPLRSEEAALVGRLLVQSALALRNLRLETELAGQVVELRRQTGELSESRRRLVLARDEEKARFAAALRQAVLPHLEPLPGRLDALALATPGRAVDLEPERQAVTAALDELRRLVRGSRWSGGQVVEADQAASRRSGPNADLVT